MYAFNSYNLIATFLVFENLCIAQNSFNKKEREYGNNNYFND